MQVPQSTRNFISNTAFLREKLLNNVVSNMYFTVLMAVPKAFCAKSKNFQIYLRLPFREKVSILCRMQFYQKLPNILLSNSESLICQKSPVDTSKAALASLPRNFCPKSKKRLVISENYLKKIPPVAWKKF